MCFYVLFANKKRTNNEIHVINDSKMPFIGRKKELETLKLFDDTPGARLIVVRGRRRIGKSRLVAEYAKGKTFIKFSGLAPEPGMTAVTQREHFAEQFKKQFQGPNLSTTNWSHLFDALEEKLNNGKIILLFDEISWMADGDASFLPKLKDFWDEQVNKNPNLFFVLCSSVSSWIDDNILGGKAFYGRVYGEITLEELSLNKSLELLRARGIKASAQEYLSILSITGGVPWYLELFSSQQSVINNISRLCFKKDGSLVNEFDRIFGDLFSNRKAIYRNIVTLLVTEKLTQAEISNKLSYSNSKRLGNYLNDLKTAGFITKDFTWSIKTEKLAKQAAWRLSDNYLRFYLKYIFPQLPVIQQGDYNNTNFLEKSPTIIALQFENLVLNNRKLIIKALGIEPGEIILSNPYFQKHTKNNPGCQIDFMIQTKLNSLYICEIRFSKREIGTDIIEEMKNKIKHLTKPKHFSCIPVLIHINGISEPLEDSQYFYRTINFSDFLEQEKVTK